MAKDGTIFPISGDKHTNSTENPTVLEVNVFEGNGSYSLYEDKDGKTCFTKFETNVVNGKEVLKVWFEGDASVLPKDRKLKVQFRNSLSKTYGVTANKADVPFTAYTDSYAIVTVDNLDYSKTYEFTVDKQDLTGYFVSKAKETLIKFEMENHFKNDFYIYLTGEYYDHKNNRWVKDKTMFDGSIERLNELAALKRINGVYLDKLNEIYLAIKK